MNTRKLPLFAITALLVTMIGSSYAATTAPVQVNPVQTMNGVVTKITGAFSVVVTGYFPIGSDSPATPPPCTWTSGGGCFGALTTGDWNVLVTLKLNTPPLTATNYNLNVNILTVFSTSMAISVPSGATAGSQMSFLFDTGTATLSSPIVLLVTVT